MTASASGDEKRTCESLLKADPCVCSVHLVGSGGEMRMCVPSSVDEHHAAAVCSLGKMLLASHSEHKPCVRAPLDELMSCIAMQVGDDEVLVLVFFDDPAVVTRLPRLMARAVAELRARPRPVPPDDGGSGGTPTEARVFVSVRDLDDYDA